MSNQRQRKRALMNSLVHAVIVGFKVGKEQAKFRVRIAEASGLLPEGYQHDPHHPNYDAVERVLSTPITVEQISPVGGFSGPSNASDYNMVLDLGPLPVGRYEGDRCNRDGCQGLLQVYTTEQMKAATDDACACHNHPPCSFCTTNREYCAVCDWRAMDE